MRRLRRLLSVLLVAPLLAPAAFGDDTSAAAWRRLLEPPPEPERPLLGLLPLGTWWLGAGTLDADPDERPGGEGDEGDEGDPVDRPSAWDVAWLGERGPAGDVAAALLQRVAVDAELLEPGGAVHRARLVAAPGQRALLARTHTLRVVPDYDAELACDNSGGLRPSAVGDPQLATVLDGLALDVRPFVVGPGRVALEVVLQDGRFERPVARLATGARFLGDLDLPRYRGVLLAASGAVATGSPLELFVEDDHGVRRVLRLTPRILDVPNPPGRGHVHALDARFLQTPIAAIGFRRALDPFTNPPALVAPDATWRRPLVDRSRVWELLDDTLEEPELRMPAGSHVWLDADPDSVARLQSVLDGWAADVARTVRVSVTARAGDHVLGRVALPALTGRSAFFRMGIDRAVLLDADTEVG